MGSEPALFALLTGSLPGGCELPGPTPSFMGICGCSGDAGHVGEESGRSPLIVQTFLESPLTQVCGVAMLSPLCSPQAHRGPHTLRHTSSTSTSSQQGQGSPLPPSCLSLLRTGPTPFGTALCCASPPPPHLIIMVPLFLRSLLPKCCSFLRTQKKSYLQSQCPQSSGLAS